MLREQILKILCQGHFISGEELGNKLGVTRAAIGKHIKAINEMGLDVYSVKGKGYKLAQPLTLIDKSAVEEYILSEGFEASIDCHAIIDSTNSFLMRKLPANVRTGDVCIAEYQSQGRGRRGRQWISPFGSHLYISMYCLLEQGISGAMGLSVAVALAIHDAIKKVSGISVQLKWPNDIYWQGKKLAGILIELEGQPLEQSHAVIGIGLNINMPDKSATLIDQPWAAMNQFMTNVDRSQMAATLIVCLAERIEAHRVNGLKFMLDEWHKHDCYLNQRVKITSAHKETIGICRGIDLNGALQLEISGVVQSVYGGEVSLRGTK